MERKFLEGLGLEKELVDKILDQNMSDIGVHKKAIEEASEKISELNEQLAKREADLAELQKLNPEGLKEKLSALQSEYDTYKAEQAAKEERLAYERRRDEFFAGTEFANEYVKRGLYTEFDEKAFKYSEVDKQFIGGKEWLDSIRQSAPESFKDNSGVPYAVRQTNESAPTKVDTSKMTYSEMQAYLQAHPNVEI